MYCTIFNERNWFFKKYDGRRREFRGISRSEFEQAKEKHHQREIIRFHIEYLSETKTQRFIQAMRHFSTIPYIYSGDGLDDYNHYQRPASNGVGYVDICPGEPGNNYYVDEPHLVSALKRKYNAWKAQR